MANPIWRNAVLGALMLSSMTANADRYFTWIDEQGRLQTTIINDENPLKKRTDKVREAQAPALPNGQSGRDTGAGDARADGLQPELAESDRPFAAEETNAPTEETKAALNPHPEFNLENFPDAEQLEQSGYLRDGEARPFFTWTDAAGIVHNSPFNPGKEINVAREKAKAREALSLSGGVGAFSPAVVARADVGLPSGAEANAAAVLGLAGEAPALLQAFAMTCCAELDRSVTARLDPGRSSSLRIGPVAPVYDFATGRSAYRLVELPQAPEIQALRLRSFIADGAFLPTLVFLDSAWQPVRMVTDIEYSYTAESWYRLGYLQALVPIEPEGPERWLLVLSRGVGDGRDPGGDRPAAGGASSILPEAIQVSASGELELLLSEGPGTRN